MHCDLLACQNAGWQGVTLNTTRGHFYRAALEGLTEQLQRNLHTLEKIGHFRATELLLVGGEAATRCGIRSKRMFSGYLSKCWMTPKPPWQVPQCLRGRALGNLPHRTRHAGRYATSTVTSIRKPNPN